MRILALPRFTPKGAGSRYRIYNYVTYLQDQGFIIDIAPFLGDEYINALYRGGNQSYLSIANSYYRRLAQLLRSHHYDLVWVHLEALPWVPSFIESALLNICHRVVIDYDDAWFHRYDSHRLKVVRWILGNKIGRIMRQATMVIAGNEYLANYASESGAGCVRILPTVVDLAKYELAAPREEPVLNIGWIGTPATAGLLSAIQPALQEVCRDGSARLTTVGSGAIRLVDVPFVAREWSEATEVAEIQQFDVGIMPLSETDLFCKGKCGLKLIQYMACGVPVVGTPVGVNREIIHNNVTGFQASTNQDWVRTLTAMKASVVARRRMGMAGRQMVERKYSLQTAAPRLAELFREAVGSKLQRKQRKAA